MGETGAEAAEPSVGSPVQKEGIRKKRRALEIGKRSAIQAVVFVGLVTLWDGVVNLFHVERYILPPPLVVGEAMVEDLTSSRFWYHVWMTMEEVLAGFAIAVVLGIGLALIVVAWPAAERVMTPYIVAFQTLPKVALAPLVIIWMGYGVWPKVALAAVIAFFPIFVNVTAGLKAIDPDQVFLMRSLRATRLQTFGKLRMYSVLPYLVAGLDVAIIFALIGAIVVEFVGSSIGLGSLIIQRQAFLDVAGTLSVLIILSALGAVLHLIIHGGGRRLTAWADTREVLVP